MMDTVEWDKIKKELIKKKIKPETLKAISSLVSGSNAWSSLDKNISESREFEKFNDAHGISERLIEDQCHSVATHHWYVIRELLDSVARQDTGVVKISLWGKDLLNEPKFKQVIKLLEEIAE